MIIREAASACLEAPAQRGLVRIDMKNAVAVFKLSVQCRCLDAGIFQFQRSDFGNVAPENVKLRVPLQVALCRRKLRGFPQACVRIADAAHPGDGRYDAVTRFFLLREIPDERRRAVVDALLARVVPGGRVGFRRLPQAGTMASALRPHARTHDLARALCAEPLAP
jgi:hypothetical protein